jgi:uncharacterized protein YecT (DUF1311 family)
MTAGTFCHAETLDDCHSIRGGSEWIVSCIFSLSEQTKEEYEKAYSEFLRRETNIPEHLNNPEEFLETIYSAKQAWEVAIDFECKAEGLTHIKDSYAERSGYYECLYHAYQKKITYYAEFQKMINYDDYLSFKQ